MKTALFAQWGIVFAVAQFEAQRGTTFAAAQFEAQRGTANGVVPLEIRHERAPRLNALVKRSEDEDKVYGSFTIAFELGTPGQKLQSLLDTGSSDFWVNTPKTKQKNTYQPDDSSTYAFNSSNFDITYGEGEAHGDWVTDTISIAGAHVENQFFGVVDDPAAGTAIFGVGLVSNEATDSHYANVPQNLKDQGHIYHNAYSMYLDNLKAATGRILFGGVDRAKYTGDLLTVPFVHEDAFMIESTGITLGGKEISSSLIRVLVDSGTTFTYLPSDIVKQAAEQFNATFNDMMQLYFISEKNDNLPDFEFDFHGAKIVIPGSEMVVDTDKIIVGKSPAQYVLGIIPTTEEPNILGDTFMRSAYLVFDLENKELSLAQSSYSGKSDIEVINGSIPDAQPAPN
ncbi:hypothetical protein TRVA0_010S01288 [Trichomonascus vanleenenianus]|uniref:pepsin-like aspartic protease n=1 Tax=Trichomonascus vanleenenianus TaxID=2268995 RepID=UPI003ECB9DCE